MRVASEEEPRKILHSNIFKKEKEVRIIFWRAMFGVEYL